MSHSSASEICIIMILFSSSVDLNVIARGISTAEIPEGADEGTKTDTNDESWFEIGASRAGFGELTDPHPSIKIIHKAPEDRIQMGQLIISAQSLPIFKSVSNIPHDGDPNLSLFKGLGVLVHDEYVLLSDTAYKAAYSFNDLYSQINRELAPQEIDIIEPHSVFENPSFTRYDIEWKGDIVPGLGLYQTRVNSEPDTPVGGVKPATLERNITEYGKNCFVEGYGQKLPSLKERDKIPGSLTGIFFNQTNRHYIRIPIENPPRQFCRGVHCILSTRLSYLVCTLEASDGAPVFCGKERKLTYVLKHETAKGCDRTFSAYHIPPLVNRIDEIVGQS